MTNVLVTCGGGFQGLTLYKSLRNIKGLVLHLFDINEENLSKYVFDYFTVCKPIKDKEEYIEQLITYISQNDIKFIFPSTAYDLELLSQLKTEFKEKLDCTIVVPDSQFLEIFNNKLKSYSFFQEAGLPVQDALEINKIVLFPVLAKPNIGWGSKGMQVIFESSQLKEFDKNIYHFVEYFKDFDEFSIDFSVNQFGHCNDPIVRKRNVVTGGFAVITETKSDYYLQFFNYLNLIKKTFSEVEMIGIYNIQFLIHNGKVYFTDLNSRIGTSCILSNYEGQSILNHFFGLQSKSITNVKSVRVLEEHYYPQIDKEKIKAIVFDLDDTLISNKTFILNRCIAFYNMLNLSATIDLKEFKITVLSLLNEGKAPNLLDELKFVYELKHDITELLAVYRTCFPNHLEPYSDVLSTLQYLKQKKYKLYILTDNPKKTQLVKINLLSNIVKLFDGVFYTADLGVEKPNLKCFQTISETINCDVSEMVMIGDNEFRDIDGALKAGFKYAFQINRKDRIVSNSLMDNHLLADSCFRINSLHSLKFIL